MEPKEINLWKTFYRYKVKIVQQSEEVYICSIPSLGGLDTRLCGQGACLRELYKKGLQEIEDIHNKGGELPPSDFNEDSSQLERIFYLNNRLSSFYLAVHPFISDSEFNAIERIMDDYEEKKQVDCRLKTFKITMERLLRIYKRIFLTYNVRATIVVAGYMDDPILCKYGHLVEQGFYSFYRGELVGVISALFPVIEGSLLSLCGFEESKKPVKLNKLLNGMHERILYGMYPTPLPVANEMVRAFDYIIQKLFSNHKNEGNDDLFNRNYWAHGVKPDIYRRETAFRLMLLIDMIAMIFVNLSNENRIWETDDKRRQSRIGIYEALVRSYLEDYSIVANKLMCQHSTMKNKYHLFEDSHDERANKGKISDISL